MQWIVITDGDLIDESLRIFFKILNCEEFLKENKTISRRNFSLRKELETMIKSSFNNVIKWLENILTKEKMI